MSLTISNRFSTHHSSIGADAFGHFPPPHHGYHPMHRHQWPTRPPAQVPIQDRESSAALVNTHSIRHNSAVLQPNKPQETISALALSSDTATTTAAPVDPVSRRSNSEPDGSSQTAIENATFTTASGPPAGIINPFDLSASKSTGPRHVLVRIDGDAGTYLSGIVNQSASQDLDLPTEVYGSQSVTNGDAVQTGWTVDYYGLSRTAQGYGNGVGWRSQEAEAQADTQGGHFGWPRKFVCSLCSLRWNAVPLPGKVIRGDVSQKDRIDLRIVSLRGTGPVLRPSMLTSSSQTRPTPEKIRCSRAPDAPRYVRAMLLRQDPS